MKTIKEIRKGNLIGLMNDYLKKNPSATKADFAILCAMQNAAQLSHLTSTPAHRNIGDKVARRIEDSLNLNAGWLDIEHVDVDELELEPSNFLPVEITKEQFIIIDELSVFAECGSGDYNDYFEVKGGLSFSKKWLDEMRIDPKHCQVIYAKGNSMYPTIQDGSAVLVDLKQVNITENKVYLISRSSNGLVLKRVIRDHEGNWIYRSDNIDKTRYPDMYALAEDQILGRIVWQGGNNGL